MKKVLVHVGKRHCTSFEPKVRKAFGIAKDEAIAGLLYLTDLEEVPPKAKRKINI